MSDAAVFGLWLFFQVVLIGLVAAHAAENDRNPWVWALIVFAFGLLGAFVYGLVALFDTNP